MTAKQLERYGALVKRKKSLETDIAGIRSQSISFEQETVKSSMTEYPYIEHDITVQGYNVLLVQAREELLKIKMRELLDVSCQINVLESFMQDIDDPVIRDIIELRCDREKSWLETSRKACNSNKESTARMKLDRYCKKMEKNILGK